MTEHLRVAHVENGPVARWMERELMHAREQVQPRGLHPVTAGGDLSWPQR